MAGGAERAGGAAGGYSRPGEGKKRGKAIEERQAARSRMRRRAQEPRAGGWLRGRERGIKERIGYERGASTPQLCCH